MKNNIFVVLVVFCGLLVSCAKWGSSENRQLMRQAQTLVEQMPDSALILLDSINTASFNDAEKMEYILLRVQARTNAEMNLTTNTEIFLAQEYFVDKKNWEKAALAGFYAAWVANAQNDDLLAMNYYRQALDCVQKTGNKLLQWKIYHNMGYHIYGSQWDGEAIEMYKKALNILKTIGDQYQREIVTLNGMANAFMLDQQMDSARHYYREALDQALLLGDTVLQTLVFTNMGVAYREQGNLDTAVYYYRKALSMASDDDEKAYIYKNLTDVFLDKRMPDSAKYYIKLVEPLYQRLGNRFAQATITYLSYEIEKIDGNYFKALEYFEQYFGYHDELTDSNDRRTLLELQKKYDFYKVQTEYAIKKRNYIIYILCALTAAFGFMLLSFFLLKRKHQREHTITQLLIQLDALRKTEQQMQQLDEDSRNTCDTEKKKEWPNEKSIVHLKKQYEKHSKIFITQYFNLLSRIEQEYRNTAPDKTTVEIESLNKILFGCAQIDFWAAAKKMIPEDLIGRIKKRYPELDITELKVCCLLYLNADATSISTALGMKESTIYSINSHIRGKLGIGVRQNIKEFLEERLSDVVSS